MKAFVLSLLVLLSISQSYATFTTINGIVLCNCMPKVDPECKAHCESMRYQKNHDDSNNTVCECC